MPEMSLFSGVSGVDGIHPVARILINNIVSKRFGLTKAEASGMTIEEKGRLLKSTFSKEEMTRLIEEEITHLFAPFKSLLYLCFPALAEFEKEIAREDSAPPTFDYFYLIFLPVPCFFAYLALDILAKRCYTSGKWLVDIGFPSSQHHANAAAQWLWNSVFPSHGVARLTNNAAQVSNDAAQVADDAAQGLLVAPSESSSGFSVVLENVNMQSVELTNEAIRFLETIFDGLDGDFDKVLGPHEIKELFSTAPKSPWIEYPYKDAVEMNAFGGLSLDAFLSEWVLMTLLNPIFCVENLAYMGFRGDLSSAIRVTRRRHVDRKKQHSERNVLQCFIFGPTKAGKSALLNYFIGRPHSEAYSPTNKDRYAVNVVDISRENKKYLVLREISESGVTELLANKESLASCDIAVFVHDRSDESSWKASSELLLKIAGHGEDTGFQVPCLRVAAKDEQDSFTMAIQEATLVSQNIGVEDPMPVSVKLGDLSNIFHRIATAAEQPPLRIPKTEAGTTRRQYDRLINRSLVLVSAWLAVTIGMVFSARKNMARKNNKE